MCKNSEDAESYGPAEGRPMLETLGTDVLLAIVRFLEPCDIISLRQVNLWKISRRLLPDDS